MESGVVVLDTNMNVQLWNRRAEDLWGLRGDEVKGQPLFQLEIGLPLEPLREPISTCLTGHADRQTLVLGARDRRGRAVRCEVTCAPLAGQDGVQGVVITMESTRPDGSPSVA
jgi:two-component system CheB/CheR fusion protein